MNREQFLTLAGQLFDAQQGGSPRGDGRAPRFDTALPAGSGEVIYASECSLRELTFQKGRAEKPPQAGKEQYAEKNKARAKALGYWVTYRQSNPDECWTGERNRERVTALPPDDRPMKHPRAPYTPRDDEASKPTTTDPVASPEDDSDIPF